VLDHFADAKKAGKGWEAHCPAHPGRHASLTIRLGDKNPDAVLVTCGRGCDRRLILQAVGLDLPDLFPDATRRGRGEPLRTFPYTDGDGVLIFEKVRWPDGSRDKFTFRHVDAEGRWAPRRGEAQPVLYRLPSLLANPDYPVFITEGERDADALAKGCEVVTTTVASGWTCVDLAALRGRPEAFVVFDNDITGWQRGQASMAVVRSLGMAVTAMRPPDEFKDVAMMIGYGRACGDLIDFDPLAESPPTLWVEDEPVVDLDRPAFAANGEAIGVRCPIGVLLSFIQSGALVAFDVAIYALAEDRAGKSGAAYITAVEAGELLVVSAKVARASMHRLAAVGLMREERRGRWIVVNPA
jgi:hypothetical protein